MGYTQNAEDLETLYRLFDEVATYTKFEAFSHKAPTLITAVSLESMSRLQDTICLIWDALNDLQKRGLIESLMYYTDGLRRTRHTTFPEENLRFRMEKFIKTANTLIENNADLIPDYMAMLKAKLNLDKIRYTPKPPPEYT